MKTKVTILISVWVLVGLVICQVISRQKMRVIFCDVGQGDGILLTVGSWQMIIDTGSKYGKMEKCLGKYLPFWDKEIEVMILTHTDEDHSGGLENLKEHYQIRPENIYVNKLKAGDVVKYKNISFEILSPDDGGGNDNNNSVVGLLNVGGKSFLLMADVGLEVEQKLVWRGVLRQDYGTLILKVSHHGSAVGTSEELLELVRPEEAVISVGKNNKFGHPTKEVLERLEKYGVRIRRTDVEGDVIYSF